MRVAFIGKMGSGKSSAANYLIKDCSYEHYSFAKKLKEICQDMWPEQFENGAKPRQLLQYVGTDMFRKYDPDVWTRYVERQIQKNNPVDAVVDDCRFLNEADMLARNDFVFVLIKRPNRTAAGLCEETSKHQSEVEIERLPYNYVIVNDGLLEDMYAEIDGVLMDVYNKRNRVVQTKCPSH